MVYEVCVLNTLCVVLCMCVCARARVCVCVCVYVCVLCVACLCAAKLQVVWLFRVEYSRTNHEKQSRML